MNELILATCNPGKIAELKSLLSPIKCIPQDDLAIDSAEETGITFIENAIIKARHAAHFGRKPALADDSGLVVPALNGEPGIYSARFAGDNATNAENIALLLERLASFSGDDRKAYFYCALAVVQHADDPTPLIATGKFEGYIHQQVQGQGGFGYDPVFYLPHYQCTAAELSKELKNTISHRALALNQLRSCLGLTTL